jgi:N-acetyl-anhydromuramyl-L-alanine amidase AmpD
VRLKPNIVISHEVVNQSDRDGAKIKLLVLHSTESHNRPGNSDLAAIAAYFDQSAVQASSHVVIDADGNSARCVSDDRKAWTCAGFNSWSLNIEQIGIAAEGDWPKPELDECARWLARWSIKHDVPLRRGAVSGSAITKSGVVTHSQLGAVGGGHSDPGSAYPVSKVIARAKEIKHELLEQTR